MAIVVKNIKYAEVAQLVEQHIRNVWVVGSIPIFGTFVTYTIFS
jgi:hypothetical protein